MAIQSRLQTPAVTAEVSTAIRKTSAMLRTSSDWSRAKGRTPSAQIDIGGRKQIGSDLELAIGACSAVTPVATRHPRSLPEMTWTLISPARRMRSCRSPTLQSSSRHRDLVRLADDNVGDIACPCVTNDFLGRIPAREGDRFTAQLFRKAQGSMRSGRAPPLKNASIAPSPH